MTVFIVMFEGIDESNCEGVFATRELAQTWIDKQTTWKHYMQISEWNVTIANSDESRKPQH